MKMRISYNYECLDTDSWERRKGAGCAVTEVPADLTAFFVTVTDGLQRDNPSFDNFTLCPTCITPIKEEHNWIGIIGACVLFIALIVLGGLISLWLFGLLGQCVN